MATTNVSEVEFRELQDFPGYRFGSDGSIWSSRRGCWLRLKTRIHYNGYEGVGLMCDRERRQKQFLVHDLVLRAFVGPRPDKQQACHANGKRSDNSIVNLRWDTWRGNYRDRFRHGTESLGEGVGTSKLTESDVVEMRRLYREGMGSFRLGKRFGVCTSMAWRIVTNQSWKHVAK
jgi:hypothetical protein